MLLLIPWKVDVPEDRWPVVNWLIIMATITVFCLQVPDLIAIAEQTSRLRHHMPGAKAEIVVPGITGALMLKDWGLKGLFGHMWLHAGLLHLAGNMLFLWIFGNALCAKIGNLKYILLYVLFGLAAGITHRLFASGPVLGASGAINGVVGMYLVLFFENEITCLFAFWFILPYVRWFGVRSIWMILFYLFWDIVGAMGGGSHVANFAHLGGFATGFGIAFLLCHLGWIQMEEYERSLYQAWQEWRHGRKDPYEAYYGGLTPLMRELKEQEPSTPAAGACTAAATIAETCPHDRSRHR
jgi:membrane associated rhomboid family serine protease